MKRLLIACVLVVVTVGVTFAFEHKQGFRLYIEKPNNGNAGIGKTTITHEFFLNADDVKNMIRDYIMSRHPQFENYQVNFISVYERSIYNAEKWVSSIKLEDMLYIEIDAKETVKIKWEVK